MDAALRCEMVLTTTRDSFCQMFIATYLKATILNQFGSFTSDQKLQISI